MKKSRICPLAGSIALAALLLSCHLMIGLEREDLHNGGNGDLCAMVEDCFESDCREVNALYEVIELSVGSQYACVVTGAGGVKCWGENEDGKLGDGTAINRLAPVDVSGLTSGAAAVAAGSFHTCALMDTGGVKCWGSNGHGQLGDGTTTDSATPVDVLGLSSGATAISVGCCYSCALIDTGEMKCWGQNDTGQLGDGTTVERTTPVVVQGLPSSPKSISTGLGHTCAVTSSDEVMCWGSNTFGQLGNGTTTDSALPQDIPGLPSGANAVACGWDFTCALIGWQDIWCWGWNRYGELGNGTTTDSTVPVQVTGLPTLIDAISTFSNHVCALTIDEKAVCWGYNRAGQLGNAAFLDSSVPVDVLENSGGSALSRMSAIAAGASSTCAVMRTGGVMCWGNNYSGQLGDGTTIDRGSPGYVHCE